MEEISGCRMDIVLHDILKRYNGTYGYRILTLSLLGSNDMRISIASEVKQFLSAHKSSFRRENQTS